MRTALILKGCPRCQGDVTRERGIDGKGHYIGYIETCLQCGWERFLGDPERVKRVARSVEEARESLFPPGWGRHAVS